MPIIVVLSQWVYELQYNILKFIHPEKTTVHDSFRVPMSVPSEGEHFPRYLIGEVIGSRLF
jgi:hypothetical protein